MFCQVAVKGMGYSGAGVAWFLGVTTSSVNWLAVSEEPPEFKRYVNALLAPTSPIITGRVESTSQ